MSSRQLCTLTNGGLVIFRRTPFVLCWLTDTWDPSGVGGGASVSRTVSLLSHCHIFPTLSFNKSIRLPIMGLKTTGRDGVSGRVVCSSALRRETARQISICARTFLETFGGASVKHEQVQFVMLIAVTWSCEWEQFKALSSRPHGRYRFVLLLFFSCSSRSSLRYYQ